MKTIGAHLWLDESSWQVYLWCTPQKKGTGGRVAEWFEYDNDVVTTSQPNQTPMGVFGPTCLTALYMPSKHQMREKLLEE